MLSADTARPPPTMQPLTRPRAAFLPLAAAEHATKARSPRPPPARLRPRLNVAPSMQVCDTPFAAYPPPPRPRHAKRRSPLPLLRRPVSKPMTLVATPHSSLLLVPSADRTRPDTASAVPSAARRSPDAPNAVGPAPLQQPQPASRRRTLVVADLDPVALEAPPVFCDVASLASPAARRPLSLDLTPDCF